MTKEDAMPRKTALRLLCCQVFVNVQQWESAGAVAKVGELIPCHGALAYTDVPSSNDTARGLLAAAS